MRRLVTLVFAAAGSVAGIAQSPQFRYEVVDQLAVFTVDVGDLDGDGDLDVYVGTNPLPVWLENDGTGRFQRRAIVASPSLANQAVYGRTGDLDGDGDLDAIHVVQSFSASHLLRNDGSGSFAETPLGFSGALGGSFELADLDGDGDLDVLAAPLFDDPFVAINDGSANFTTRRVTGPGLPVSKDLVLADFDGDGDVDAVLVGVTSASVLLRNHGDATFAIEPLVLAAAATDLRSVVAGDFDGDGDIDLVAMRLLVSALFTNDGSGAFAQTLLPGMAALASPAAIDVDGDGDEDVIGVDFDSAVPSQLALWLNDGSAHFADRTGARVEVVAPTSAQFGVGDFDGDGDPDVVAGTVLLVFPSAFALFRNHDVQLAADRDVAVGGTLRVVCSRQPGYATGIGVALIVAGREAAPALPTVFGTVHVDPRDAVALPAIGLVPAAGEGEVHVRVPADPSLAGLEFAVQGVVVDLLGTVPPRLTGRVRVLVR